MDFNYSEKSLDLQKKLNKFFEEHIYPIEQAYDQEIEDSGNSLHIPDILDELKNKDEAEEIRNQLAEHKSTLFALLSTRGKGVKAMMLIEANITPEEQFNQLKHVFKPYLKEFLNSV